MLNSNISFKKYQDSLYDLELKEKYLSSFRILEKLMIKRDIYLLKRQLENVYFHSFELNTLLYDYRSVVLHISSLFKDLLFIDPIQIFSAYSYFIQNGFLSCDKKFVYRRDVDDLFPLFGINVIDGMGVCRHITSFLTDVYRELGFVSYNVSTISSDLSCYSLSLKEFECDSSGMEYFGDIHSYQSYLKKDYNHLVTLVVSKDGSFVIDPTNSLIFYVNQDKKVTLLQDENITIRCGYEKIFNYNIKKDIRKYYVPVSDCCVHKLEDIYYQVF